MLTRKTIEEHLNQIKQSQNHSYNHLTQEHVQIEQELLSIKSDLAEALIANQFNEIDMYRDKLRAITERLQDNDIKLLSLTEKVSREQEKLIATEIKERLVLISENELEAIRLYENLLVHHKSLLDGLKKLNELKNHELLLTGQ